VQPRCQPLAARACSNYGHVRLLRLTTGKIYQVTLTRFSGDRELGEGIRLAPHALVRRSETRI